LGAVRAVGLVLEGNWAWYRRNWRATAISSVLQPVLMLLSFGLGLGSLLRPGAVGGVPYLVFLAPALLAAGCVQLASMESTYPVLSGFTWQRVYWAVVASPISATQLAVGQLAWLALRLLLSGSAFLVVAAVFGALRSPWVLVSLLCSVLCGIAFGFPVMAVAATVRSESAAFNLIFRFAVLPMVLFAGTFFPVDRLPALLRPLAELTPLWHGTELSRGIALGTLSPASAAGHLAYLLVWVVAGVLLVRWRFHVRLMV
jgi:lipooligosaccharide transport system permease protein